MKSKPFSAEQLATAARESYLKEMLRDCPVVTIDQSALSIKDLVATIGLSGGRIREIAANKVKSGEWERVSKRVGNQLVPAYRPVRKGKSKPSPQTIT